MTPQELVLHQFPGKLEISLVQAGAAIGYAAQTCYNLYHQDKFPLPVHKTGQKRVVTLIDLIHYVERRAGIVSEVAEQAPIPLRNGRPTKREAREKREAAAVGS